MFPSTKEARESLAALKQRADTAARAGDYTQAQKLAYSYKEQTLELRVADQLYNLVLECEKDSKAAYRMEFDAMEYAQAGEWDVIIKACEARLREFRDQQAEQESSKDDTTVRDCVPGLSPHRH